MYGQEPLVPCRDWEKENIVATISSIKYFTSEYLIVKVPPFALPSLCFFSLLEAGGHDVFSVQPPPTGDLKISIMISICLTCSLLSFFSAISVYTLIIFSSNWSSSTSSGIYSFTLKIESHFIFNCSLAN